jgi:hypothetical protein
MGGNRDAESSGPQSLERPWERYIDIQDPFCVFAMERARHTCGGIAYDASHKSDAAKAWIPRNWPKVKMMLGTQMTLKCGLTTRETGELGPVHESQ